MAPHWKCGLGVIPSRVRIPLSPPRLYQRTMRVCARRSPWVASPRTPSARGSCRYAPATLGYGQGSGVPDARQANRSGRFGPVARRELCYTKRCAGTICGWIRIHRSWLRRHRYRLHGYLPGQPRHPKYPWRLLRHEHWNVCFLRGRPNVFDSSEHTCEH